MFLFKSKECLEFIGDGLYLISHDHGQTWNKYQMSSPVDEISSRIHFGAKFEIIGYTQLRNYGISTFLNEEGEWEITEVPQWQGCQTQEQANAEAQSIGWENWEEAWEAEFAPISRILRKKFGVGSK